MKPGPALVFSVVLFSGLAACQKPAGSLVNFGHLDHLSEKIELNGRPVTIVHIYANFPDYQWVDAKESGPEGIACVDDAARAAVVYLRDYELNHRTGSLDRARGLLDFILTMQTQDGEYYNFVLEDRSINFEGKTSFKSFGWWAARAMWALGCGYRIFESMDPSFAEQLGDAVERSLPHVYALLQKYDTTTINAGYDDPTWLLYGSGADATSELMMGLVEYYQAHPSPQLREAIVHLAKGLMLMQEGNPATFPYGLHRSWRTLWHLWGNGQSQALAAAGRVLQDSSMIGSARREAEGFYPRLLVGGLLNEMDLTDPPSKKVFDQIAYGVRPMALGLLRLYDATGDRRYLLMAGLSGSWLFGNNPAGAVMYDSASGRCFDGIRSTSEINRNSGAESTIEALMTLVDIEAYPEAVRYLRFARIRSDSLSADFVSPTGEKITLRLDPAAGRFRLE
jgi:hypothetical protein